MALKRFDILGGCPADPYSAILLNRQFRDDCVRVIEQNPQGAACGFGVAFSDEALDFLKADDPLRRLTPGFMPEYDAAHALGPQ